MTPDDATALTLTTPAAEAAVPAPTLAEAAAAAVSQLLPPALAAQPALAWLAPAPPGAAAALLRQALAQPAPIDRPLLQLGQRLPLTLAELLVCALAREVELDPLWPPALSALQAVPAAPAERPTLGLAARALVAAGLLHGSLAEAAALLLGGRALASGLLLLGGDDGRPLSARPLSIHPQLLPLLLGDARARRAQFGAASVEPVDPPAWPLPSSWQQALDAHAALLAQPRHGVAQLVLRAGLPGEAAAVAACLGARLGRPVLRLTGVATLDGAAPPALPPGLLPWLVATDALPLLELDAGPGDRLRAPAIALPQVPLLIALGGDGDVEPASHGATRLWRLALPAPAERAALWRDALGAAGAQLDHAALGRRHACGVSTLHAAAAAALTRAGDRSVDDGHVAAATCTDLTATTHGLGALAALVPPAAAAAAFVADGRLRQELDLLLARCSWREQGSAALGPALHTRQSTGVRLLFVGASGTGKTLAGQWLAERLGKPLYRVDLAATNSKYIGETEKNLAQLLARAEQLDCVLLFDEADSVFGARTEVHQANDRFANTQTNYLLQRIEQFTGIALLTSNSKARFDEAFMRRLDQVVEFPLPRGAARLALWRAHLGEAHALTEAQLKRIAAEIDLPGGNVRNIAVSAMLAAVLERGSEAGAAPALRHLLPAAALEYAKLGRGLPDSLARLGAGEGVPAAA